MEQKKTRNVTHQPDGMLVVVPCPHCNMAWAWTLKRREKKVITCPSDEGGCDKDFVVQVEYLEATINTYELT